ncbi:MAG: 1,4-dihydroxy-2-naphthoate octaprenyltransferase [Candidatus Ancillula trichonymphae]|jgi:1,4-dihydroxy-2-naphthoate octaprenyltransferase|nr:1,4-dihydroxy-2-naphthoate octaprenyltransferase [Candidatus Ancillula trichonymphae]
MFNFIKNLRPLSLWASYLPVIIGGLNAVETLRLEKKAAVASAIPLFVLCLLVAIFLQLGSNYANEYYDSINGVDKYKDKTLEVESRPNLESGVYKKRFFFNTTMGAITGLALVNLTPLDFASKVVMLIIGIVSLVALYAYAGSKHPYGHSGFGELAVFTFFGLVGTLGTYYIELGGQITCTYQGLGKIVLKAISIGLVIAGMLMINNLRDIQTDAQAQKRTIMVKLGAKRSVIVYISTTLLAGLIAFVTTRIYLLTISCIFLVILINIRQFINLKEQNYKDALIYNTLLGFVLTVILIF